MFSRLAWRYDLVNDVMSFGMHRRWKRQTVRLALSGARPGARVLDLCCGSGDLCFLAEELRRGRGDGRRLHAPDARGGPAAAPRGRPQERIRPGRRAPASLPRRDLRRRHGQLRPAQHRGPRRGASRRCAACSRPEAARSSWISESPTSAFADALYRAYPPNDHAGRRLALPRRPRDLRLHSRLARALPGAARRRAR